MSHGGYDQVGYGQTPYGNNPYDQRDDGGRFNNYSQRPYDDRRSDQHRPDPSGLTAPAAVEMQPYGQQAPPANDPNAMRNECRDIDNAIGDLELQLKDLDVEFNKVLSRPDASTGGIDALAADIMTIYRNLGDRIKKIKSKPQSADPRVAPQVRRIETKLKETFNRYQTMESSFRKRQQEAAKRQFLIVNPDATEAEVQEAVADPGAPVFQQALFNSSRRGQAQSTLNNVRERHETIQKIEQQFVELVQLFQDMQNIVVEQEAQVIDVEQKGEQTVEHVQQGTTNLGTAVEKARSARRKKWYCLGIAVLIVIVIVIIVIIVVELNKKK